MKTMTLSQRDYPKARRDDVADVHFGTRVPDPYRWLEDEKSDEVKAWVEAQDRLARAQLAAYAPREALRRRLRELYYVDSISLPVRRGGRLFYSRTHKDREKAVVYYREGEHGAEHVLLDPNQMSPDGSISLGVYAPSYDGKTVAYSLRRNNADEATLYVLSVDSGQVSDIDVIEGAKYAHPSWTPQGDGFYYTYLPTDPAIPVADRPGHAEIRFHRLGTDPRRDLLVHRPTGDPRAFLGCDLSRDGRWLFVYVQHGWNATDVYYRDARAATGRSLGPARGWRRLVVGTGAQYQVTAWKDRFYILTNEGAPRWRVLRTDSDTPDRESWREIVPQAADAVLDGAQIIGGHLVLTYLQSAHHLIEVRTLDGAPARRVDLPGLGTTSLSGDPDRDEIYYAFSSFTTPPRVFRAQVADKSGSAPEIWAQVSLPIDPSPYTVEQVRYISRDGTPVSMFLIHRKDLRRDGSTPFLLSGYGGFNVSLLPTFSAGIYPFLEAGGGLAIPNLRGGGEYGEAWHQAGARLRKQTVFDDFVWAADYLVRNGYTRPERLAIRGGSNGGLLVGAALTQRPDLFRAVVCEVPLLDMVRYHLFGSGKTWIPEYGSAEKEEEFKALYAYSPYHRIKPGTAYPAVLLLSADSDDRVDPLHARKMAAALQAASESRLPVLLRVERQAGHGGADLIHKAVERSADAYAFLMQHLQMGFPGPGPGPGPGPVNADAPLRQ
jgi:prolyl oligopeptidase